MTRKLKSGKEPVILADGGLKGHTEMMDSLARKSNSPQKRIGSNDDLFSPNDPLSNNFTLEDPESKHLRQQIEAKR